MTTTTTKPTSRTLAVPGAELTYDIRPNDTSTETLAADHRLPDGRERLRDAGRALPRPHRR